MAPPMSIRSLCGLAATFTFAAGSALAAQSAAYALVQRAEHNLVDAAWLHHDAARLQAMLAPGAVTIGANGQIVDQGQRCEQRFAQHVLSISSVESVVSDVRDYGPELTSMEHLRLRMRAHDGNGTIRSIEIAAVHANVWVRYPAGLRLQIDRVVSSQLTVLDGRGPWAAICSPQKHRRP